MSRCNENAIGLRNYIRYTAASLRVQCIERVRMGATMPYHRSQFLQPRFRPVTSFGQKTHRARCRTHEAQVNDKSGSVDPFLGILRDVRLPHMTRCPYLYAYAASRS